MAQMAIFLSHNHKDNAFAAQLVAALRGAGADVWYDEHNPGAGILRREIDAAIWHNKGLALYDLERYQEALAAYQRALALDPDYRNAWIGRGLSLRALGHVADAEAAERRAQGLGETQAGPESEQWLL